MNGFKSVVFAAGIVMLAGCDEIASRLAPEVKNCAHRAEKPVAFMSVNADDRLVAESIGEDCETARLLFYVEGADGLIEPLHLGLLKDYSPNGLNAENAGDILLGALEAANNGETVAYESYGELEAAGAQPGGAPWRGTPLVRAEYERLVAQSPRKLVIPTDLSRAKLIVWDEAVIGRPVVIVYYGD